MLRKSSSCPSNRSGIDVAIGELRQRRAVTVAFTMAIIMDNVRFAPESRHVRRRTRCLLCAKSGHSARFAIGPTLDSYEVVHSPPVLTARDCDLL
jgi:hypothetical protein